MVPYTEVPALLRLIDDPDTEVYQHVKDRILTLGKQMVPHLEAMWEQTPEEQVQERLEFLIHKLHFGELQRSLCPGTSFQT
jgi:hypothetical protein